MNKHKHPEVFQKRFYNKAYFEGWYYKQTTADGSHTLSFIPGVNYDASGDGCFIQCLHLNQENELRAYNVDYDIEAFATSDSPFSVSIDDNRFCLDGMHLNIKSDELKVSGRMRYSKTTPIETSPLQPNIMGFFSYIPNMECNHGVISMGHDLIGSLKVNGEVIDFTGGKGYMEKDWGRSFPSQYLWIQSNHFDQEDVSLFCSVATIPFGLFSFKGFICNLIHEGKEYRFATYNGSKLKVETFTDTNVHIELSNRNYSLIIEGHMVFCG